MNKERKDSEKESKRGPPATPELLVSTSQNFTIFRSITILV